MLRLRRYRIFLVFAILSIFGIYYFSIGGSSFESSNISVESLKNYGGRPDAVITTSPLSVPVQTHGSGLKPAELDTEEFSSTVTSKRQPLTTSTLEDFLAVTPTSTIVKTIASSETSSSLSTAKSSSVSLATLADQPWEDSDAGTVPYPHSGTHTEDEELSEQGQGRKEPNIFPSTQPVMHWTKFPEHFPLPSESVIPIPSGKVKKIPKIQYNFKDESSNSKIDRQRRLAAVEEAFDHAWSGYKELAWLHDELRPVSGDFRDPFCGWAATLVDTLDTLWIMGKKSEFEEAVNAVEKIDFTTSPRKDIPLFETVIRYLGGLLAAYDISGQRYRALLDKAIELGEILMGAFDTPNRMPVTYYRWMPTFMSQPHRASTRVVLAEIGSLSMEFTRLAQLTRDAKYYDAIARITNEFEIWQNNTKLAGMWPVSVDASGCKKLSQQSTTSVEHALLNGPQSQLEDSIHWQSKQMGGNSDSSSAKSSKEESDDDDTTPWTDTVKKDSSLEGSSTGASIKKGRIQGWGDSAASEQGTSQSSSLDKRQLTDLSVSDESQSQETSTNGTSPDARSAKAPKSPGEPKISSERFKSADLPLSSEICEPQGLGSPPKTTLDEFTLGGMSDSVYEYLPKEYLLLGGVNDQYRTMYEYSMETVRKYLIFRAMIPNEDRKVLFSGSIKTDGDHRLKLKPEGQHLTCFAGGMFALGAKIFGLAEDMDIAKGLTDGCVWAYEATTTGIMPEGFIAVPCEDQAKCPWNETKWHEILDPWRQLREDEAAALQQKLLEAHQEDDEDDESAAQTLPQAPPPRAKLAEPDRNQLDSNIKKRQVGDDVYNRGYDLPSTGSPAAAPVVEKDGDGQRSGRKTNPIKPAFTPKPIPTHEQFVQAKIEEERLPPGFVNIWSPKYILRPEAIESVFILYRTTGDEYWREKGWQMFTAIQNYTRTEFGNSAIKDVTSQAPIFKDEMESFWLAETLKYFYLLFSDPSVMSLDDYVL
ncbi:MAG: hypothetical protein M1834_001332 [Cirrosporium novae-zelandiae]|nr:MAG: hypothetical protein M1834_001332 [Cirrosporium novae-zelandiae]